MTWDQPLAAAVGVFNLAVGGWWLRSARQDPRPALGLFLGACCVALGVGCLVKAVAR